MFNIKTLILFFLVFFTFTPASAGDIIHTYRKALPVPEKSSVSCPSDAVTDNSLDGRRYNTIGFHFYKRDSYEAAIKYYLKAIGLNPEYPVTYNNLGIVYLKRHELDSAEQCFRKAIDLDPVYVKAICNLAVLCLKQKRNAEALALYNRAKKIDPSYVRKRVSHFKKSYEGSLD